MNPIRHMKDSGREIYQYLSGYVVEKTRNPVEYNGVVLDVNCGAISTRHKARFFPYYTLNDHSIRERILIDRHLPDDLSVVELGGGIGYISAYIDQHIGENAQVVVEPNPRNAECNEKTRRLNDCDYALVEGAYSPNSTEVSLSMDSKFSSASTVKSRNGETVPVQGYSLSTLRTDYGLDRFALVCDIEGGEFSLLDEELDLLVERVPLAIIEFHEFGEFAERSYVERVEAAGFDVIDEEGGTYTFRNRDQAATA